MTAKKKQLVQYLILALVAVVALATAGYSVYSISQSADNLENSNLESFFPEAGRRIIALRAEIISRLNEEFEQYGEWPLKAVSLSPGRGNPFTPK